MNWSTIIKFVFIVAAMLPAASHASDSTPDSERWRYIPTFHGTMRAFYQQSTTDGEGRFIIRNARLSAGGFILPSVDYFLQVDFCDRGKIKLLDAFMRVAPTEGLQVYLGQMRVPFSIEACRLPHLYYFTDVGLVTLYSNLRSVGIKAGYTVPGTGLYAEGGVFNASDMADHTRWNSAMTYGIKTIYTVSGFKPEVSFMSRVPGGKGVGCRINQLDAGMSWQWGGLFIEGEYLWRHYCGPMKNSVAYSILADYGWPVKWKLANRMSVQARYEGITAGSSGQYTDGHLPADMPARKRLTLGATSKLIYQKIHFDLKINYEQYFYHDDSDVGADDNSKLVAGAVMYF